MSLSWRERVSNSRSPCSSRHRVGPQARISLYRSKRQRQSRPSGKGVGRSLGPPRSRARVTLGGRFAPAAQKRKLVAMNTRRGSKSCPSPRNLLWCLGGRGRKARMQKRSRGDYTIANRELVAEGADLRVQVLSPAAGQLVPWHYHSEISDNFVCLE